MGAVVSCFTQAAQLKSRSCAGIAAVPAYGHRMRFCVLLSALAVAALIVSEAASAASRHPAAVLAPKPVVMRAAPDAGTARLGRIPAQTWVRVSGQYRGQRTWYRVRFQDRSGWVTGPRLRTSARTPQTRMSCADRRSLSLGTRSAGQLRGGVQFPQHGTDHFTWNFRQKRVGGTGRTQWGHCQVVASILRGIAKYRRQHPDAPPVAVGDLSFRHGGTIDGHSTHQNGRQVDLYFPRRDRRHLEPFAVSQVDMRLTRALVSAMLATGARTALVGEHTAIRTSARVIRWPYHDDHVHLIY
jgi:uncharacterized protein YraI